MVRGTKLDEYGRIGRRESKKFGSQYILSKDRKK